MFLIRPIRPDDKDRLAVALSRLSEETIRRRFFAAKPRLSAAELRYLTEVDGHDHIALVAVLEDDLGTLAGVARCVRFADAPETAEMAIVVGDAYQGMGLGRALALALADAARDAGIERFAATMLGDNRPAQHLMRTIARRLEEHPVGGGLREVTVELEAA